MLTLSENLPHESGEMNWWGSGCSGVEVDLEGM